MPFVLSLLALPAIVAAAGQVFSDVPESHPNDPAITFLKDKGVVKGYADGSFKPDRTITRAEFVKILIALRDPSDNDACKPPSDVTRKDWFYAPVCLAMQEKIVLGAKDGLFHPGDNVTLADASVMLARAYGLHADDAKLWYESAVRALGAAHAIPDDVAAVFMNLTRAQVAEMLWRLQNNVTDRGSADIDAVLSARCSDFHMEPIAKVDMQEVERVWLGWINGVRAEEGLEPLAMSKQLMRTAWIWSDRARAKGGIDHKRDGQTAYYDYGMVGEWFKALGLEFASAKSASAYTENIGWGYFRCSKADCTGAMIDAMRTTFDFFMSEKGKAYAPHYNSIVSPAYKETGMAIAVDADGKYFLTAHYGTHITSDPDPICD